MLTTLNGLIFGDGIRSREGLFLFLTSVEAIKLLPSGNATSWMQSFAISLVGFLPEETEQSSSWLVNTEHDGFRGHFPVRLTRYIET